MYLCNNNISIILTAPKKFQTSEHTKPLRSKAVSPPCASLESMQSTFRCGLAKESLVASLEIGPTFGEFSIITEELASHEEVDCDDICILEERGAGIGDIPLLPLPMGPLLPPGPLKGYDYPPFNPQDKPWTNIGHTRTSPTQ